MGFQPENKWAQGHGRPPKEGFSDPEITAIGEEMLQWMKDNDKKEIVHLSEFYSEIKNIDKKYWKERLCRRPVFAPYWRQALDWMGKKLLKNKKIPSAYGNRYLGIYHREVAEYELEMIKQKIDYEYDKKIEALMKANVAPNDPMISDLISSLKSLKEGKDNDSEPEANPELQ